METGTSADARRWIETSSLPQQTKAELLEFVANFEDQPFFRDDDQSLAALESKDGITLPPWLKEIRRVLTFVDLPVEFRLDAYDDWTPREDSTDVWYTMEWGYSDHDEREYMLDADVYPAALWIETARSYLAVRLKDPHDTDIYEYASEDLIDDRANGDAPDSSVFAVFDSYPAMLRHVTELKLPDGTLIPATPSATRD